MIYAANHMPTDDRQDLVDVCRRFGVTPPDHENIGTTVNNLAGLYRAQGRLNEAEPVYERGLAITEKAMGPDHPDVASCINNSPCCMRTRVATLSPSR